MDNIRINKITVNVNKKYNETTISLYKTNQLLGSITNDDIDVPSFENSGVSLKAYQLYCKDVVINLIDNGGIEGFYYEPKSESSIKYDMTLFRDKTKEYIKSLLGDAYTIDMTQNDEIISRELYNDKYIKDACIKFSVYIPQTDTRFMILSEIKSGQMCRPKKIYYNDNEYTFNITGLHKIM